MCLSHYFCTPLTFTLTTLTTLTLTLTLTFSLSLSLPSLADAYETKPWLEEDFLPKYTLSLYGDGFSYVPTCAKTANIDGWMIGIGNDARIALFGAYSLEGELLASLSACRDASLEALRLTARMLLTNDSVGEPFSSMVGYSFTAPTNQALHDINRFYHGRYESEFHYAIGREFAPDSEWLQRTWGVGTIGITNRGSPWIRLHLAWETRLGWETCLCLEKRLELFATSEIGLGRHCFPAHAIRPCSRHCCPRHFPGYASIRYRFIDLGFIYRQEIENIGDFTLRYTARVFAYNFPGREQALYIALTVPFSLNF